MKPPRGRRVQTERTLQRLCENNQVGSLPALSSLALRSALLLSSGSCHTGCPSVNRSLPAVARSLDAKIAFQCQRNLDPALRHTPVFILKFVLVVIGRLLDGILRILVELLDVIECLASVGEERSGSHRPNAVDTRKLPQDLVIFIFENGSYVVFVDRREKSTFVVLTGFADSTVLEVFPNLLEPSDVTTVPATPFTSP